MAPIYSVAAVAVGMGVATIQGRFSHEGTVMPLPPAATDAGANRWMAHHLAPASDRDSAGGSVLVRPPHSSGSLHAAASSLSWRDAPCPP